MNSNKKKSIKSTVALIKCDSYIQDEVFSAVKRGIDILGGIEKFIRAKEKILLKPNLLSAHPPEECVTTHPSIFKALARIVLEAGCDVSYGDSPPRGKAEKIASISGLEKIAIELNIPFENFEDGEISSFSSGIQNKQFLIARPVLNCDGIISLPKLKTHHLTRYTGAIKNQFGYISGFTKPEFHVKLPGIHEFSKMLVDLTSFIPPRLFVMDGIQAMQGNGPAAGSPYNLGVILISDDPVALDSVACKILDLKPDLVLTNFYGQKFGLGNMDFEKIEIKGDSIFKAPDFEIERKPTMEQNLAEKFSFLKNLLTSKPVISKSKCNGCNTCISQCPVNPKAIYQRSDTNNKVPKYDYNACIRCFCCQEVCPQGAISVKKPIMKKLIELFY